MMVHLLQLFSILLAHMTAETNQEWMPKTAMTSLKVFLDQTGRLFLFGNISSQISKVIMQS